MSPSTTSAHRRRLLLGLALAIAVAFGSALVATGASRGTSAAAPSVAARPAAGDCVAIGKVVGAAATTAATTTASASSAKALWTGIDAARGQASTLARSTVSDDTRESVQNLADDLAAYRLSVTSPGTDRHADIAATVRADLTALRRLCGH